MARLQTARLENFIRRWGSIKGPGSVLAETLGDVFPVLDLENLSPENYATAGWYPFWIFGTVVGVAAQTSGLSLINPVNSTAIVVVDHINIRSEKTTTVSVGTSLPLFTTFVSAAARDTRLSARTGVARMGANANVGAVENGLILRMVTNVDREITLPHGVATLAPGTQVAVVSAANDNDLTIGFLGHHRLAEPSELSF